MKTKIIPEEDLENKIWIIIETRPAIVMFSPIIKELENGI